MELEGRKIFEAGLRKYLRPTNERKQMSTKTIKQRIAVVAVSALTAGFFSVVTAPQASAAASSARIGGMGAVVQASGGSSAPELALVKTASATGDVTMDNGLPNSSVGFISDTSTTAALTINTNAAVTNFGGGAKTATVAQGSKIGFYASNGLTTSGAAASVSVVVTGGTLSQLSASTGFTTIALSPTATTAVLTYTAPTNIVVDASLTLGGVFNVTGAPGSTVTIASYSKSALITGTSSATAGELTGIWTLTVAAASASGTVVLADSTVTQQACIVAGATTAGVVTTFTNSAKCQNGQVAQIYVNLVDAYGSVVTGGALAASSTSGLVNVVNASSITAADYYSMSAISDTGTIASGVNYVLVRQPTANTAGTTTVTITYKGSVVGTFTPSWVGAAASITLDSANSYTNIRAGQTDTGASAFTNQFRKIVYVIKDAAGNAVDFTGQPTVSDATGSMLGATTSTSTGAVVAHTTSVGYGATMILVPAETVNLGTGTVQLKITDPATSVVVKSTPITFLVSSGSTPASFTASWDKAVYSSGEIAKLTLAAKDAYGNNVADGTALAGAASGVIPPTGGFTAVGTVCTVDTVTIVTGKRECSYAAGNTEGSYSYSIDMTTSPTNQSAIVGTIKVVPSTAVVSNADVLKSIVALIASINKQIQALQKLILKM